jgi:hypothetical protein
MSMFDSSVAIGDQLITIPLQAPIAVSSDPSEPAYLYKVRGKSFTGSTIAASNIPVRVSGRDSVTLVPTS